MKPASHWYELAKDLNFLAVRLIGSSFGCHVQAIQRVQYCCDADRAVEMASRLMELGDARAAR